MLGNLFSIGRSAMQNAQTGLTVHGNNVSNLKTPGYRRRSVIQDENMSIRDGRWSIGTGASIDSIRRNLSQFLERGVLDKSPEFSRWSAQSGNLSMVEKFFVESKDAGISKSMSDMWAAWQALANNPQLGANRVALAGAAEKFSAQLNSVVSDLRRQQGLITDHLKQEVGKANDAIKELALLNKRIIADPTDNTLLDRRDVVLRGLSSLVDISVQEEANGQVIVSLGEGQKLVEGDKAFELKFEEGGVRNSLVPGSAFKDEVHFSGQSGEELTIQVVSGGNASGAAPAAQFKVSRDGGKTWISNPDGSEKLFNAGGQNDAVTVGGVKFWFGKAGQSASAATTQLKDGDRFILTPKSEVRWYKNTSTSESISPVPGNDGERRLKGGSIAGLLRARDEKIGSYIDKLNAFAKSMVWEVNRAHSQGAGLTDHANVLGSYGVRDATVPLSKSNLPYADKMTAGSFSMAFYNAQTGNKVSVSAIDFSSIAPGTKNFDPSVHSLENVRDAINASFPGKAQAVITNGKLSIKGVGDNRFQFSNDSSGVLAGLGMNTFFEGSDAASIQLHSSIKADPSKIAAAHVNGAGEVNKGDNSTARAVAALAGKKNIGFKSGGTVSETSFNDFYSSLVATIGSDSADAKANMSISQTVLKGLVDKQESVGGVNLDEEMQQIMSYQQSYKSAAQLIKTANQMFDVLLSLKS
ncbi:flagellar hook-associated protein FlgK [Desulfovibrio sp. JC010]|uniref:flagellar hook-associated protein FlgK n=1 Tax=Desulfovibrio sp. JC010 TaxID=2593641 RepID=UPI0013D42154|nr:flagellar hook-associated protein FlgK [Desulfovibrio sp. JC010]NDV26763.1 flagellar hook-associated protein FlgK [Desulfovibrio sp. JC010]